MYFCVHGNSIAETFDRIGVYHVRDMPTSILPKRTNLKIRSVISLKGTGHFYLAELRTEIKIYYRRNDVKQRRDKIRP